MAKIKGTGMSRGGVLIGNNFLLHHTPPRWFDTSESGI